MRASFLAITATAVSLCGCTTSTGVLPAGPDTYTLTERASPILGGSDTAEKNALTKATDFCTQQGRKFVPANLGQVSSLTDANKNNTGYVVTFKCPVPNDPAIASYQLQQAPNVVIEQRNR